MTSPSSGAQVEDPLADQTAATPGQPSTVRIGTVQAADPIEVLIGGVNGTLVQPKAMGIHGMYRPRIGDVVALLGQSVDGSQSSGSTWLLLGPVSPGTSADWGSRTNFQVESQTIANTAYDAATFLTFCATPFVVPPSGKILLAWSAELRNTVAGSFTLISPEIRTGSVPNAGNLILAASDNRQIRNDNVQIIRSSDTDLIDLITLGATRGQTLNVTLLHRVGANTGPISRRRVTVTPAF